MEMRDKPTLEFPEKMCDYCCNFDREHIGMDGTALCKLTMTLAYAEDYGGNCMFYNVPKERIILPPCNVGDKTFLLLEKTSGGYDIVESECVCIAENKYTKIYSMAFDCTEIGNTLEYHLADFGRWVFLTKEEAEAKLKERVDNG